MTEKIIIGNIKYLIEQDPIGSLLIEKPTLVVWGKDVLCLDYTWSGGWVGSPKNIVYGYAKVSQLNKTKFFHTSPNELRRVIKTNSKRLNERFGLEELS